MTSEHHPAFHTEPGAGPVTLVESAELTVRKVAVGPMDNNAYLLRTPRTSALIDAAAEADTIAAELAGRPVAAIITTHHHHDHIGALSELTLATGAEPVCGEADADAIREQTRVLCRPVVHGERIAIDDGLELEVISLVGHTPGSITLVLQTQDRTLLFTGDSLFPGGPGKTGSPHDFASLMDHLTERIFDRFEDAEVHPGHGDSTTLAAERPHLQEWRARGW